MITTLGCVGLGLVWGWLIGLMGDRLQRPLSTLFAVVVATSLVGLQAVIFTHWSNVLLFLGAAVLTFLLHRGWRRELRQRFKPRSSIRH